MRTVHRSVELVEDLGTDVIGVPRGSELELDLRLESVLEGVLVSGAVRGHAAGECVRCLAGVDLEIDTDLQELFAYPDRVIDDEGDDVRSLVGDHLDLGPAVRDVVVLALPFQPVCRDDCPGLCSVCGARLADGPGHRHEVVDPRWAALSGLLAEGGQPPHPRDAGPAGAAASSRSEESAGDGTTEQHRPRR